MTHNLLSLFREPHSMDTLLFAEHLGGDVAGWTEARVYRVLNAERREERAPPLTWADVKPKKRKHEPTAKLRKAPYSGFDGRQEWDRI
jgi:hypothetical protein